MKKIKTLAVIALSVFATTAVVAQKANQKSTPKNEVRIPMKPENWVVKEGFGKFADHNGLPSVEVSNEMVTAKDVTFSNGTIEFDVEFVSGFVGIYFRQQSEDESEFFYLRDFENPTEAVEAVQYAPIIKKVNMWDMYHDYQTAANFKRKEWAHIKLVVSGAQMLVYVNDTKPTLIVPKLEGNTTSGKIAFQGNCFITNVVVKHNEVEGLNPTAGFDPTHNDTRYIRNWQLSVPMALPQGQELSNGAMPDALTNWTQVTAEQRGLINITRIYGQNTSRKAIWLRTKITSKTKKNVKVDFGFSDEAWVFLNDRLTYVDKNLYGQGMRKTPNGRISIENSTFELQLNEGENELVIGVANDFYGWGIMARLGSTEGLVLSTDYKPEIVNKEFEQYFGVYSNPDVAMKFRVSQKNGKLSILPTAEAPILMDQAGKDKFTLAQYGITIDFKPGENKFVFTQGTYVAEFKRE